MGRVDMLCDWLEFTLPYSQENENAGFSFVGSYSPLAPAKPLHGYGFCQKNEFGATCMTNRNRPEMGVHVTLPGQQLEVMREMGEKLEEVAADIINANGHASRVDLTSDYEQGGLKPQKLMQDFEYGKRAGTARKASIIYELFSGSTIYIGSWKSDRFARLYEKTRSFEGMDTAVLRCELVSKQDYARAALIEMAEGGVGAACNAAVATIDKMCGFHDPEWKRAMADKSTPMVIGRKAKNEGDEWLMNIVVSAVAKRLVRVDGKQFWDRFSEAIARKVEAYGYSLKETQE